MDRTFSSPSIFGLPNSSSFTCWERKEKAVSSGARARSLRGEKRRWARARGGRFPRKPKAGAVGDQPCGSRLLLRTERGGEGGEELGLKPLLWTPLSSAQQRAIDGGLTVTGHCCVEPGWKPNGESQTPRPGETGPKKRANSAYQKEGGRGAGVLLRLICHRKSLRVKTLSLVCRDFSLVFRLVCPSSSALIHKRPLWTGCPVPVHADR